MSDNISIYYYKSPIGELILGSFEGKLCLADWRYRKQRSTLDSRIQKGLNTVYIKEKSEVITQTITQFEEYFKGERKTFTIPLLMVGTPFQKSVWEGLLKVPYGETSSYLDLAKSISSEKAVRAVASANGANTISLMIPCHRIIGKNGDLVGYAGGLDVKKRLLELENNLFSSLK